MRAESMTQEIDKYEVDLIGLWRILWSGKLVVIISFLLTGALGAVYALKQPDVYKASIVLMPTNDGGAAGLGKLAGQFGGLASLAGISLGGSGGDKVGLAFEVLKSRAFIESFVTKHEILVPLIASAYWERDNQELILDADIYDIVAKRWVREVNPPKMVKPSNWEAFQAFSEIMHSKQDKDTGVVTLTIEHVSPVIAKQWLELLVRELNFKIRELDKNEAQNGINYLTAKLQDTKLSDMRSVFYQLIEEQTKTLMLAEVSNEYVLKTIDPANVPDERAKPQRVLIVAVAVILGCFFGAFVVFVRHFRNLN